MTVLDTLRSRLAEAQVRLKETTERLQRTQAEHSIAQTKFQQAQIEHQAATQEFNAFSKVVEIESKREDVPKDSESGLSILTIESTPTGPKVAQIEPLSIEAADRLEMTDGTESEENPSKTQRVRQLINDAPGITPAQLWEALKGELQRRGYLYSVLGRLKDREQVIVKRGRYYPRVPKPKTEELMYNYRIGN